MSAVLETPVAPVAVDPGPRPAGRVLQRCVLQRRGLRRAMRPLAAGAGVLAFWYGATGMLLAFERSAATRLLALGVAVLAAGAGVGCTLAARRGTGSAAAARAVLGGALLWLSVSTAFYGGWVVGPAPASGAPAPLDAAQAPSIARAIEALTATVYSSLLAAALLAVAVCVARPSRVASVASVAGSSSAARYAPATFATLWAAHELAKLNVFVGVASPGAAYLPAYLAHLRRFFGPAHNSPLLAGTIVVLGATAALVGWRARRLAGDPARRTGLALLASILALAALEHAMLGVRAPPRWWDVFVAWRDVPARTLVAADSAGVRRPGSPADR